ICGIRTARRSAICCSRSSCAQAFRSSRSATAPASWPRFDDVIRRSSVLERGGSRACPALLAALVLMAPVGAWSSEALVAAARANDAGAAAAALEAGGDAGWQAPDGTTALHWAVYNGNLALVERLV